jgi:hypothetical protein
VTTGSHPNPHVEDSTVGPHGSAEDHGETHGHDDHAHAGETLGPVDTRAWGALVVGVGAGLLVAWCLVIATQLVAATPA